MVQMQSPHEDIRQAVRAFCKTRLAHAPLPPFFAGPNIDYDHSRARFGIQEEISALEYAVDSADFDSSPLGLNDPLREANAYSDYIAKKSFGGASLTPERLALLRSGVARALLEEKRNYLRRLDDPFAKLTLSDPLFAPECEPASPPSATKGGPCFSEATAAYVKAKAGVVWTPRTEEENRRILRLAAEHFGATTPITAITLDNVRAFRDSVIAWRKNPSPTASLAQISNAPVGLRIGPKTAAKYFQYLTAAFSYWTNEGFLDKSPVGKLSIQIPHHSKVGAREPFSPAELSALFSSPIFTGCASVKRRTLPGDNLYRDGLYWGLLIAPLSGMRITEIVQLALDDINFTCPASAPMRQVEVFH